MLFLNMTIKKFKTFSISVDMNSNKVVSYYISRQTYQVLRQFTEKIANVYHESN
jgi:hypothetical protein